LQVAGYVEGAVLRALIAAGLIETRRSADEDAECLGMREGRIGGGAPEARLIFQPGRVSSFLQELRHYDGECRGGRGLVRAIIICPVPRDARLGAPPLPNFKSLLRNSDLPLAR
jgi:hypothetical protein